MSRFEIIPIKWEIAKKKFHAPEFISERESFKERLAFQINIESEAFQELSLGKLQEIYLGAILSEQKCLILANLCAESKERVLALLSKKLEPYANKDKRLGEDIALQLCGDCELYFDEAVSEVLWIVVRQFAYARGVILDIV